MSGERVTSVDRSFAFHSPDILSRIPNIVYVGSHSIGTGNSSGFAAPDVAFSRVWDQVVRSPSTTRHIVGLRRENPNFGIDYSEYLGAFTHMTEMIGRESKKHLFVNKPAVLDGRLRNERYVSVGQLYYADEFGVKSVEPLEHFSAISLYPSEDYARSVFREAIKALTSGWSLTSEDYKELTHLQTCIPYSESQLAANF